MFDTRNITGLTNQMQNIIGDLTKCNVEAWLQAFFDNFQKLSLAKQKEEVASSEDVEVFKAAVTAHAMYFDVQESPPPQATVFALIFWIFAKTPAKPWPDEMKLGDAQSMAGWLRNIRNLNEVVAKSQGRLSPEEPETQQNQESQAERPKDLELFTGFDVTQLVGLMAAAAAEATRHAGVRLEADLTRLLAIGDKKLANEVTICLGDVPENCLELMKAAEALASAAPAAGFALRGRPRATRAAAQASSDAEGTPAKKKLAAPKASKKRPLQKQDRVCVGTKTSIVDFPGGLPRARGGSHGLSGIPGAPRISQGPPGDIPGFPTERRFWQILHSVEFARAPADMH